jgi:hypothetical protein
VQTQPTEGFLKMRNLQEHPITVDEVIECLKDLKKALSPEITQLGDDMRPLLLDEAIKIVEASGIKEVDDSIELLREHGIPPRGTCTCKLTKDGLSGAPQLMVCDACKARMEAQIHPIMIHN